MKNKKYLFVVLACIVCAMTTTSKNPILGTLLKESVKAATTAIKTHNQQKKNKSKGKEPAKVSSGIQSLIDRQKESSSDTITEKAKQSINQPIKETGLITLTVSSDGPTKDEATKNALRTAIEQAFGTFVSANTTILNDEVVKDEIVTVSNGSIKDYKEISSIKNESGGYLVTLSATVSLSNLISYAKNHGSECEFAGNTFAMEMKLYELEKENELKVLYNLTDQILLMLPTVMNYTLKVDDPRIPSNGYSEGDNGLAHTIYYYKDREAVKHGRLTSDYAMCVRINYEIGDRGKHLGSVDEKAKKHIQQFLEDNIQETKNKYYEVPMSIHWVPGDPDLLNSTSKQKNEQAKIIPKIVYKTLTSIALNESQIENYKKKGLTLQQLSFPELYKKRNYSNNGWHGIYLRNSEKDIDSWINDLYYRIYNLFNSFVIVDNTGTESNFYPQYVAEQRMKDRFNSVDYAPIFLEWSPNSGGREIFGTGIFYSYVNKIKSNFINFKYYRSKLPSFYGITDYDESNSGDWYWTFNVWIPRDEISKYSNFRIETKE